MVSVATVVSRRRSLASLALVAGVAIGTNPALAQSRLSMELDRPVIAAGESVGVQVFGHFPTDAFALAQAEFDLHAPAPKWTSASSGIVAGDSVWGATFEQVHQPWAGQVADPSNPMRVWKGAYTPDVAGPAFLRLDAKASFYSWYPSDLTSSTAVGDADPARAYLWVDPFHIPGLGEVAPGAGTRVDVLPDGKIVAEPDEDEAILIGLLLPAVQKVRDAAVRMEFASKPSKATPKLMLSCATGKHASTEELALNYEEVKPSGSRDPVYELSPSSTLSGYILICIIGPSGELICQGGRLTAEGEPIAMFDRIPGCLNFKIEEDPTTGGDMVVATTCDEDPFFVEIPGVFKGFVAEPIEVRLTPADYLLEFDGIKGESIEATGLPPGPAGSMTIEFGGDDACIADFDGDGELTFFDFLAFQDAFSKGLRSADLDGDSAFTFFDFLAFQKAYAAGC